MAIPVHETISQLNSATGLVWAPSCICYWLQVSQVALFLGKVGYCLECLSLLRCVLSSSNNFQQAQASSYLSY